MFDARKLARDEVVESDEIMRRTGTAVTAIMLALPKGKWSVALHECGVLFACAEHEPRIYADHRLTVLTPA